MKYNDDIKPDKVIKKAKVAERNKFQLMSSSEIYNRYKDDPEFVAEYERLQRAYELQRLIVVERQKLGLNQRQLADRAGMDPSDLSKIERGVVSTSTATLDRIARALNKELVISFK